MGSKSNDTSTNSTSSYYDSRSVNDAGGGIAGSGNQWDQSVNNVDNRTNTNSGNTTWTQTTTNTDSSSRSYDNSGNTTWTQNTTDGGAFKLVTDATLAQTEAAKYIAKVSADSARENAAQALKAAQAAQEGAIASVNASSSKAFDFASSSAKQAFDSNAKAIGFAGEKFDTLAGLASDVMKAAGKNADSAAAGVRDAYASAASQANGNKTLTIAALAAVAVVAAVVVFKKG